MYLCAGEGGGREREREYLLHLKNSRNIRRTSNEQLHYGAKKVNPNRILCFVNARNITFANIMWIRIIVASEIRRKIRRIETNAHIPVIAPLADAMFFSSFIVDTFIRIFMRLTPVPHVINNTNSDISAIAQYYCTALTRMPTLASYMR